MTTLFRTFLGLWLALVALATHADINIVATTPEWGALAQELGGDKVKVHVATTALQDVHHVDAKPSLIAQVRSADLVLSNGADLEIAWLPRLLRTANNARVMPGRLGNFEAVQMVPKLEIPTRIDRSEGDIHPQGNPHIHLDPRNIRIVADMLAGRFAQLDPSNFSTYQTNWKTFDAKLKAAIERWEERARPLRGMRVIVHHKSFSYLNYWLGLKEVGALEPLPGIEPSREHLTTLVARQQAEPAKLVLRAAYQSGSASQWFSTQTSIPAVTLPYTIGGTPAATDLFSLFDDTLTRLLQAAKY